MTHRRSELERAFEIAQSGTVLSVEEIKTQLKREGFSTVQITGRTLLKQLRSIINSAQTQGS